LKLIIDLFRFDLDVLKILLPIDLITIGQMHKIERKSNHEVYLECLYLYVIYFEFFVEINRFLLFSDRVLIQLKELVRRTARLVFPIHVLKIEF